MENAAREEVKLSNSILIHKGEKIPCSVTESFYTTHDGQKAVNCKITESTAPETDQRFVTIIDEITLNLPEGRPKGQEIKITYAYDENQIMECTVLDVETGKEAKKDLTLLSKQEESGSKIERFMVE